MISSWQIQVKVCVSHSELQPVTSLVQTMCHLDCLYTDSVNTRLFYLVGDLTLTPLEKCISNRSCARVARLVESTVTNCGADHQNTGLPKQMWMSSTSLLSGSLRTILLWVAPVSRSTLNPIISTRTQTISPLRQLVIL